MSNTQAYRHSWDQQKFFYYHQDCVDRNPPGPEVTFEQIALDDVPQDAQCDFCYELVHAMSGYQVRAKKKESGSIRKPFNNRAGYVASRKNALTNIHNVIYVASEQGIDAGDNKYVTVCEAHSTMISCPNIPKARDAMKDASQWCGACQELAPKGE